MKFAAEGVSSIMDRPIQIGRLRSDPRGKERAGRPAQYSGAVAAITGGGELAGVIGLGDFVHQTR